MDAATTERVAKLGTIFRDAAEHFEALGKLFGQMVELQVAPGSVGSTSSVSSPAPNSARKKKFIAERFWSLEEISKLEEGLALFGLDPPKLKEHIGTTRPNRDVERIASMYIKADLVPRVEKRKRDDSPTKESNKRQKTSDGADLPSVKGSQEKKNTVSASPSKKSSATTTPSKGKDKAKEAEKKKKHESLSSDSESSEEENNNNKSHNKNTSNGNNKKSSSEEESSSEESNDDFD